LYTARSAPSHSSFALIGSVCLVACAVLGTACAYSATTNERVTPSLQPTSTDTPVPASTATPTPALPAGIYVPYGIPDAVAEVISNVAAQYPNFFSIVTSADAADIRVTASPGPRDVPIAEWVYAVVVPFPSLVEDCTWVDVESAWRGKPSVSFSDEPLLMTVETAAALASTLGDPSPGGYRIISENSLLQKAWNSQPSWAIVEFQQLEPRWKVADIDGWSVLDKELDTDSYPLVLRIGAVGSDHHLKRFADALGAPVANRDTGQMTVLAMTGVTALARGTATRMETHGVTYPAQDIRDWLLEADITHISNEVSFAQDCPPPANNETMVFCSNPKYIDLFTDLDIDVVELTGNHLLDWGVQPMRDSLRMLEERAIPYYGGGWDIVRAREPLTITHGANTFGFIGCNPVGPASDWATETLPGSAPCDFDLVRTQVRLLRDSGVIPIVTLQYWEFYQYEPTPKQRQDFRSLAEAGAAIVSGSQAHQPQGFEFYADSYIHYGLGNLFFDQMWSLETRQEFLDFHYFYNGQHISTVLRTAILEDYARPRPMTPDERSTLLRSAFAASAW
jgi:hypothetical protein